MMVVLVVLWRGRGEGGGRGHLGRRCVDGGAHRHCVAVGVHAPTHNCHRGMKVVSLLGSLRVKVFFAVRDLGATATGSYEEECVQSVELANIRTTANVDKII